MPYKTRVAIFKARRANARKGLKPCTICGGEGELESWGLNFFIVSTVSHEGKDEAKKAWASGEVFPDERKDP